MAYKLYVPIGLEQLNDKNQRQTIITKLKNAGTETIFIVPNAVNMLFVDDEQIINSELENLTETVSFLKGEGFKVGIWYYCFGVGGKLPDFAAKKAHKYNRKKSIMGVGGEDWREKDLYAVCPEDEEFLKDYGNKCQQIASARPDMIMIDDDMVMSIVPGLGCFCDTHMKIYRDILGEDITIEEMKEKVFTGYNEKYRKAWLKGVGDSLRKFARCLRESIDRVDTSIRLGFATSYTSFDIEGADAFELSEIMAGETKPFLRLTGAPYWCETNMLGGRFTGQKTPTVIEFVRIQKEWAKGRDIEFFFEGDTYPRSAYYTSAAMCEAFDIAIRAIGGINGQKYLFPYSGNFNNDYFENTYYNKHIKNKELCKFIEEHFADKCDVGIKMYEKMRKMETVVLPDKFAGEVNIMEGLSIPNVPKLFSVQGIPLTYDESDVAVAFGDNVREIEKMPKKLILDVKSALILQNEKGIDLGIESVEKTEFPRGEVFGDFQLRTWIQTATPAYYKCKLSESVKTDNYFIDINGEKFPASFVRTVGDTEYFVLIVDMAYVEGHNEILLSYPRKEQLNRFVTSKIPHVASKCSGSYIICKSNGKDTSILVQNHWEDPIDGLTIQLDKEYQDFEIFGGEGYLKGDKFVLTTELNHLASVAIALKG